MFNEEERKYELSNLRKQLNNEFYSGRPFDPTPGIDKLISQEKSMIEQAKKEVMKEFAEKIKIFPVQSATPILEEYIDSLLKEYGIEI